MQVAKLILDLGWRAGVFGHDRPEGAEKELPAQMEHPIGHRGGSQMALAGQIPIIGRPIAVHERPSNPGIEQDPQVRLPGSAAIGLEPAQGFDNDLARPVAVVAHHRRLGRAGQRASSLGLDVLPREAFPGRYPLLGCAPTELADRIGMQGRQQKSAELPAGDPARAPDQIAAQNLFADKPLQQIPRHRVVRVELLLEIRQQRRLIAFEHPPERLPRRLVIPPDRLANLRPVGRWKGPRPPNRISD